MAHYKCFIILYIIFIYYITVALFSEDKTGIKPFRYCLVLNCEIHKKVIIYVYLQFKSEFNENDLVLTSLEIP